MVENVGDARIYNPRRAETVGEWAIRHRIPRENGKYIFYHATPKRGGAKNILRKGSYLEADPDAAVHFAGRDRDLKSDQINLHKLLLSADEFDPGMFPLLRQDTPISKSTLQRPSV